MALPGARPRRWHPQAAEAPGRRGVGDTRRLLAAAAARGAQRRRGVQPLEDLLGDSRVESGKPGGPKIDWKIWCQIYLLICPKVCPDELSTGLANPPG